MSQQGFSTPDARACLFLALFPTNVFRSGEKEVQNLIACDAQSPTDWLLDLDERSRGRCTALLATPCHFGFRCFLVLAFTRIRDIAVGSSTFTRTDAGTSVENHTDNRLSGEPPHIPVWEHSEEQHYADDGSLSRGHGASRFGTAPGRINVATGA
jgi:hypothetical protein